VVKKRGRPKKVLIETTSSLDHVPCGDNLSDNDKDNTSPVVKELERSKETSSNISNIIEGKKKVLKKRGRPRINRSTDFGLERKEVESDDLEEEESSEEEPEPESEEEEYEVDEEEEKQVNKKRRTTTSSSILDRKIPQTNPPISSSAKKIPFEEESKLERLTRLANILQISIQSNSLDIKRAFKTMRKINEVSIINR
jgi:hypothetical protein